MNEKTASAVFFTQCDVTDPEKEVIAMIVQRPPAPALFDAVSSVIVMLASGRWVALQGITSLRDARSLCVTARLPDQPLDTRTGVFWRNTAPRLVQIDAAVETLTKDSGKLSPFLDFDDNTW
jgi:hypothetical protein